MAATQKLSPRVLVAFACVYLFWGSTYLAMRTGVAVLPPLVLAAVRFLIAGPLMLALCKMRGLPLMQTRRNFTWLVIIGVLMLGFGNTGIVFAERYISSGFASLLVAVIPIYVALLESFLPRGDRLNLRGWIGILIGFAGLLTLVSPSLHHASAPHQKLGAVIALGSAFAWSCASVLSRRARITTPTFVAAAWEMLFAGVFDLFALLATGGSQRHIVWNHQAIYSVAWLVMFGSLVGYTAYIYLLDNVPVAKVSTYAYINPIVAVLLGALLLHERLHAIEYLGMFVILAAVYLVTGSRLQPRNSS